MPWSFKRSLSLGSPHQNPVCTSPFPHNALHASPISFLTWSSEWVRCAGHKAHYLCSVTGCKSWSEICALISMWKWVCVVLDTSVFVRPCASDGRRTLCQ
jgi:hypothetical protein